MTHDHIGNSARVWRMVLSRLELDDDALQLIRDEIGGCPECWQEIAESAIKFITNDLVACNVGNWDALIGRVEQVVAHGLDAVARDREERRAMRIEHADLGRGSEALRALARKTGHSLAYITELAETRSLGELFDTSTGELRMHAGPWTPSEAKRKLERGRTNHVESQRLTPFTALAHLRAKQ